MPIWRYSGKEVSEEDLKRALRAVRAACFKCGDEMHSDDCSIYKVITDIYRLQMEIRALKDS